MTSQGMRQWSFSSRCCVNALQLSTREDCGKVHSWLQWLITGLYSYMEMNRLDEFGNIPEAMNYVTSFSLFTFCTTVKKLNTLMANLLLL